MIPGEPLIGIIGLGYVGLPLAVAFGKTYCTLGFDIDVERIEQLRKGCDITLEVDSEELLSALHLRTTSDIEDLRTCNTYIITVPTPIDQHKRPDLRLLEMASRMVGNVVKQGDVIIYESTVYPGMTEEVCVPLVEDVSGLSFNVDFHVGYSPERINPGDRLHRLQDITKVTSGSTADCAQYVDQLYASIIEAGTHRVSSIKVAEAAKIIENTQRDVNIALVNELALIFNRIGIDTLETLRAAGTKWNFVPFRPGLVGGHCIGVDPYYLTHKAMELGYHPEVILAGRRLNDRMGEYVAEQVVKLMARNRIPVVDARILVMGLTFKENCPDLRNTRVVDVVRELESYNAAVDVYDPMADPVLAEREYGLHLVAEPAHALYDAMVICVAHDHFRSMGAEAIRALGRENSVIFDVKSILPEGCADARL